MNILTTIEIADFINNVKSCSMDVHQKTTDSVVKTDLCKLIDLCDEMFDKVEKSNQDFEASIERTLVEWGKHVQENAMKESDPQILIQSKETK